MTVPAVSQVQTKGTFRFQPISTQSPLLFVLWFLSDIIWLHLSVTPSSQNTSPNTPTPHRASFHSRGDGVSPLQSWDLSCLDTQWKLGEYEHITTQTQHMKFSGNEHLTVHEQTVKPCGGKHLIPWVLNSPPTFPFSNKHQRTLQSEPTRVLALRHS